jgi:hypothetical protein
VAADLLLVCNLLLTIVVIGWRCGCGPVNLFYLWGCLPFYSLFVIFCFCFVDVSYADWDVDLDAIQLHSAHFAALYLLALVLVFTL